MRNSGYKGMLRDRCPKVVDYALKWQKAKEKWIDHAYANFIKFYVQKQERYNATRIVLGYVDVDYNEEIIAKYYRNFDFDKSIEWENLTKEETAYWKRVSSWVRWFSKNYAYIENMYSTSRMAGKDDMEIKIQIVNGYLSTLLPSDEESEEEKQAKYEYVDKLVEFLVECCKR